MIVNDKLYNDYTAIFVTFHNWTSFLLPNWYLRIITYKYKSTIYTTSYTNTTTTYLYSIQLLALLYYRGVLVAHLYSYLQSIPPHTPILLLLTCIVLVLLALLYYRGVLVAHSYSYLQYIPPHTPILLLLTCIVYYYLLYYTIVVYWWHICTRICNIYYPTHP